MSAYRLFLVVSGVAAFASHTAFTLNIAYQSRVVGLDPLQLILVGTVMEAVCFVTQVPTGVLADRYGRRPAVVAGHLLMGTGLLLWGMVPAYAAILAAVVVWSIGAVCVDGALQAWAAGEIGEDGTGRAFVRAGQCEQAGMVLGIVAAVALTAVGPAVPIVAGGALTLLLGLALAAVMRESPAPCPPSEPAPRPPGEPAPPPGRRRGGGVLLALVAGSLFAGMSSEGFDRLTQPRLLDDFGLSTTALGGIAVVAALGAIVVSGRLARYAGTGHPRRLGLLVTGAHAAGAAAVIGFALSGHVTAAVAYLLAASLLRTVAGPILAIWLVSATTPERRATAFSIQAQGDALGQIAGGPPAGLIAQRAGPAAGIATAGLFLVPAAALFLVGALAGRHQGQHRRRGPPGGVQVQVLSDRAGAQVPAPGSSGRMKVRS